MVGFLAAWFKSFVTASYVLNNAILLTGAFTFWSRFIRLCSDLGVFFSVTLCVVLNGLPIVDWLFCIFWGSWILFILLSCWFGPPMTIASLLFASARIWSFLRNSSLSSNWMTFFTLCWDVQGNGWSSRYDTLVKFIALLFQLNWSGLLFSFKSDALKSTYSSCLFVLWSEPPLLVIPCDTWCVSGSIVSGFGCVSKLSGFCAIFLGIWGGFHINIKVDLVWTLIHTHCLILHLILLFLLDPLLLVYVI